MRHLNEIVRERNQYSRDALEAWQDFINLKGRMDTELGKVTKRNNFLVEELESWKQQVSLLHLRHFSFANMHSSSNSKHSLSNLPRRLKISRSRLRVTSGRTDVLRALSINRKTMQPVFLPVLLVLRSNVMMLLKHLYFNKKLLRSLSVSASATRRNFLPFNTPTVLFFDNVMRLNALFFISAV